MHRLVSPITPLGGINTITALDDGIATITTTTPHIAAATEGITTLHGIAPHNRQLGNPAGRATQTLQVWQYRYFHLVPYRKECLIELWENHQINFIGDDGAPSGPHGEWNSPQDHMLAMRFHYAGKQATIRRNLTMQQPDPLGPNNGVLINTNGLWPVTMLYHGMEHRVVPLEPTPTRAPPGSAITHTTPLTPPPSPRTRNLLYMHWPEIADRHLPEQWTILR